MMNKINCKDQKLIKNENSMRVSQQAPPTNHCQRNNEKRIRRYSDGSIDYNFYDRKTRVIRAKSMHEYLSSVVSFFRCSR